MAENQDREHDEAPRDRRAVLRLLEDPDEIVREQAQGFVQFLIDHAVVGVAIGFIVGLQSQTLIKQLVDSFVAPFITLIVGPGLRGKAWVVDGGTPNTVTFPWGQFVYAFIDFLVVLLFIYIVVKLFKFDRLEKKKNGKK